MLLTHCSDRCLNEVVIVRRDVRPEWQIKKLFHISISSNRRIKDFQEGLELGLVRELAYTEQLRSVQEESLRDSSSHSNSDRRVIGFDQGGERLQRSFPSWQAGLLSQPSACKEDATPLADRRRNRIKVRLIHR